MNRPTRLLILALAIIAAGCLTAGCAQGANIKKALSSASPRGTTSISPPASSAASSPPASSRPVFSPARTPASLRPPATVHHTVTASATPPAAAPGSQAASQATGGTASSLLWLWILLGVLLIVIVVIVAIVATHRSRRRSARTASWWSQAADASAKGSALYDAISLAGLEEAWDTANAEARWADIRRRADHLAQLLYQLLDSAPAEADRARVAQVLTSLQAVRSAMETAQTPGGPSARVGARMNSLLRSFGASLRVLRSPDVYGF